MPFLRRALTQAGMLVALTGCAAAPPPAVQTGPDAEVTVDGLHRVDHSVMALAYVKPDLDLAGYTKLMLDDSEVAYRKDPRGRRQAQYAGEENYALTPSQMQDLKAWFREALVTALTENGGYQIVEAPGPEVLRVSAHLIDLEVRIPTENRQPRTYARSFGEVTLILELFDSESGEILARVADRRDPTVNPGNALVQVTPGAVKGDTRRLFEHWAGLLRFRLDEIREVALP